MQHLKQADFSKADWQMLTKWWAKGKREVLISHTNENGEWLWAVVMADDEGFWLDALKTEDAARKWATDAGMTVVNSVGHHP